MEVISPIQPQDQVDPQSLGISPQTWAKLDAVKTKVNNVVDRVERLNNQMDILNVAELQRDPDGRKKVEQIQKTAAYYSEELLKQLMTLGMYFVRQFNQFGLINEIFRFDCWRRRSATDPKSPSRINSEGHVRTRSK